MIKIQNKDELSDCLREREEVLHNTNRVVVYKIIRKTKTIWPSAQRECAPIQAAALW